MRFGGSFAAVPDPYADNGFGAPVVGDLRSGAGTSSGSRGFFGELTGAEQHIGYNREVDTVRYPSEYRQSQYSPALSGVPAGHPSIQQQPVVGPTMGPVGHPTIQQPTVGSTVGPAAGKTIEGFTSGFTIGNELLLFLLLLLVVLGFICVSKLTKINERMIRIEEKLANAKKSSKSELKE